jgi:hypothetical protein
MKYTILESRIIERVNDDNSISYIPTDPANSDYQAYLESIAEDTNGNN